MRTTSLWGFSTGRTPSGFWANLRERFTKFNLEQYTEKTRLLEFGPYAAENRQRAGQGKPETFDFLGFTHMCGEEAERTFHGGEADDSEEAAGEAERGESRAAAAPARPDPEGGCVAAVGDSGASAVLRGADELAGAVHVLFQVGWLWHRALRRRGQNRLCVLGADAAARAALVAPSAAITHPYPSRRLGVVT